jgi:tRNA-2-methylthio-N6-dimethylallyladenosine synthase
MNRYYNREDYLNLIAAAKERIPDVSLTSDIIVGFPGETYEDFKETLSLVETVKFSSLFTFIYSKRPGTPAELMEDNVSREEKGKWFDELLNLQEKIAAENINNHIGKTYRVLCDEILDDGILSGHTSGTISVEFEGDKELLGNFADVKIISYSNAYKGVLVK